MRLYDLLKNSVDHTGLPVMNCSQFIATTEKYGKEEFRKVLAEFITKEKPPYPLKKFNQEKVVQNFRKLQKADYTNSTRELLSHPDRPIFKYSGNLSEFIKKKYSKVSKNKNITTWQD